MLKALLFALLVSKSASAALVVTYDREARYLDKSIRDSYQLDSQDSKMRTSAGVIVFLFRELKNCQVGEVCNRLSLAWIPPNGPAVELPIDEEQFLVGLKLQSVGVGLDKGSSFKVSVPRSLQYDFGAFLDVVVSGNLGEKLEIKSNGVSKKSLKFIRSSSAVDRLLTSEQIENRLSSTYGAFGKEPNFIPQRWPNIPELRMTIYKENSTTGRYVVISRPSTSADASDWMVGIGYFDSADLRFKLEAQFANRIPGGSYFPFAILNRLKSPFAATNFLVSKLDPLVEALNFESKKISKIPGLGVIVPGQNKFIEFSIQSADYTDPNYPKYSPIFSGPFEPLKDMKMAETVGRTYVDSLRELILETSPPEDSFFGFVEGQIGVSCNTVVDPSFLSRFKTLIIK